MTIKYRKSRVLSSITHFPFVCPFFTWYFIPLTFLYLLVQPGTGQAKGLIGCSVLIFCCVLNIIMFNINRNTS